MTNDASNPAAAAAKQYTEMVQQGQQALLSAVDSWTKTVRDAVGQFPNPTATAASDPDQVIDQVFDFAAKMLEVQRGFSKQLVNAAAAAAARNAGTTQGESQQQG